MAAVWPLFGSRAAAIKETQWVLRTSDQLLRERRQAYCQAVEVGQASQRSGRHAIHLARDG